MGCWIWFELDFGQWDWSANYFMNTKTWCLTNPAPILLTLRNPRVVTVPNPSLQDYRVSLQLASKVSTSTAFCLIWKKHVSLVMVILKSTTLKMKNMVDEFSLDDARHSTNSCLIITQSLLTPQASPVLISY